MKWTLLALLACLIWACSARPKPKTTAEDTIRCFKVTQLSPYRDYLGQVVRYDSFYAYIYTWNDQLLYRTSYIYTMYGRHDSLPLDGKVMLRYRDFVFTKQQPSGALYDLNAGIFNKKSSADSMLRELWVTQLGIFNGPSMLDTVLISRNWQSDSDTTLTEEYHGKLKRDTTFKVFSTMRLWYTKPLKSSPFSFSRRLDSLRGQQVCRVSINNRIEFVMEGKPQVSAFTQNYTLQEIPVTNVAELQPLFERQKRGEYSAQVSDVLKE